jgi:alkylation response protein AidB-like acyl-CoA dehydrogenase
MDVTESPEQRALRAAVAALGAEFGFDYWLSKARARQFPDELWQKAASLGFIGVNTPAQYGGGGAGITELSIICEELAAAGCPLLMLVVSPAICASIIAATGTAEQQARWLPPMASGSTRMAFAITEPDAGSNAHNIATIATEDAATGDFLLSGRKYYISGVDHADHVLVVGQSPSSGQVSSRQGGSLRPGLFVVPTDADGFQFTPIDMDLIAPERQFFCYFDGVRVPRENVVGGSLDAALPALFAGLNPERITVAAFSIGTGRLALAKAARYANERTVWGQPIGAHQGIAHPLAKAYIELELAKLMLYKAATAYDAGDHSVAGEASNIAKYSGVEAAWNALDAAIQTHGGNGMASEYGLAALLGEVRAMRIAPVSKEMILNYVAQHSLGLPKSY